MKFLAHTAILIIAAAIGLATGFVWRGRAKPAPTISGAAAPPPQNTATPLKQRHVAHPADDSPLVTKLQAELAMSAGVTNWLCWLEALEKATAADFPRLARLAKGNPAVLRFVAARWTEVAPREFFESLAAAARTGGDGLPVRELGYMCFREWAKKDPEAAIAALNRASDLGQSQGWRFEVVNGVMATDVERGLQLLGEWHIGNYGPSMTAVTKWAAANPQHAAEFTIANNTGYASRLTMQTVGREWAKNDPAGALAFAASRSGELAFELGSSALKQWSSKDLNSAADWLASTDERTCNRLSPAFVETWAKKDAAGALTWCQENLTGSSLAQSVAGVVKGAADKDVSAAAALVGGMEASAVRTAAALEVAQKFFPDFVGNPSPAPKPEAIVWLSGLDDDARRRVLEKVTWEWAASAPSSMAKYVSSLRPEEVPAWTDSVLARQMARKAPSEAIDWAASLPGERGLNAGAEAFAEWRTSQPEAAIKWFNELPANDSRRPPFFKSAIQTLAFHPQAAEQLAGMNQVERAAAREVVQTMPYLPEERRSRLLEALAR